MTSAPTGQRLPAAEDRIDIGRVEFQPVAAPASALGGHHRRTAAEEDVEHDIAAGRAVEDRIGDHCHRLHGRMQRRQVALLAAAGEGVGSGVSPDIAAVTAELAELDIVAVRLTPLFKHKDKLVVAAVERAHPGIVLDPDAEVFQLAIDAVSGGHQLLDVAPVHADEVQGAVTAECREVPESLAEKGGEFGSVHLARGHRKGAMMDRAEATRVTIDRHIVGRVDEYHCGPFLAHQRREGRGIEGIAAQDTMAAEDPRIADLAERGATAASTATQGWHTPTTC